MKWIGISGRAGAGKDFLATRIWEQDHRYVRVAFADGVRNEIERTLLTDGCEDCILGGLWNKPYPDEVRRLLQWWGTDLRRAQDPDYWVKKGIEAGYRHLAHGRIPMFTDVRFPNEAAAIRDAGGFIVVVSASDAVRQTRLGGVLPPEHESESGIDQLIGRADWIFPGNIPGTAPEYQENVAAMLAKVRGEE